MAETLEEYARRVAYETDEFDGPDQYIAQQLAKAYLDREEQIKKALEHALRFDGAHHKNWIIDQMARALTGDEYERWVAKACEGEDGSETYIWDVGIAP